MHLSCPFLDILSFWNLTRLLYLQLDFPPYPSEYGAHPFVQGHSEPDRGTESATSLNVELVTRTTFDMISKMPSSQGLVKEGHASIEDVMLWGSVYFLLIYACPLIFNKHLIPLLNPLPHPFAQSRQKIVWSVSNTSKESVGGSWMRENC